MTMEDVSDRSRTRGLPVIAATILAALFAALAIWWVCTDTRPQQMDPATHLRRAISYADAFRSASPRQLYGLWRAEYGMYTYPPLFHLATGAVIAAGASPALAAAIVNSFFAWLLLLSIINLGQAAFNFSTGLAAAALCLSFMTMAFLQRTAFPDFALAAMVAWCCRRLLLTDAFSNRRSSIIFGLAVGAAMLIKQMALPFCGIAAACLLIANWRRISRATLLNIFLAAAAALLIALPWYGFHHRIMREIGHFNQYIVPAREGDPMPWTCDGATYYLQLILTQLGPPLAVLSIAGAIAWFIRSRQSKLPLDDRARQARLIILAWLIGGLLLVTFLIFNKDYRYHAPVLPALAFVMASLLALPQTRFGKSAIAALMLVAAGPYFFLATVGTSNPTAPRLLMTQWNMPPLKEDWRIAQLLDDVAALSPQFGPQHPPRLGVVPHCESYGHPSIHLEFARRGLPVLIEGFADKDPAEAASMDLLLTKTGDQGEELLPRDPELINRYIAEHPSLFTAIANYPLPDGSQAMLYRVVKPKQR
jgi:4-amino-4-deoxy-L-arabinose transferase-like glycosyltransferase